MKGEKKCKLFVFKTCCAYELSNVKKVSNIRMVKKGNKRKFTGEKKIMKSKLNKIYQKKMDANKIYIKKILHIFFCFVSSSFSAATAAVSVSIKFKFTREKKSNSENCNQKKKTKGK